MSASGQLDSAVGAESAGARPFSPHRLGVRDGSEDSASAGQRGQHPAGGARGWGAQGKGVKTRLGEAHREDFLAVPD